MTLATKAKEGLKAIEDGPPMAEADAAAAGNSPPGGGAEDTCTIVTTSGPRTAQT